MILNKLNNLEKLKSTVKCSELANRTKLCHGPDIVSNSRIPLDFYLNYPDQITYQFNSQGFRDSEWPDEHDAAESIWCIGDSSTLGVGCDFQKIWPSMLAKFSGQRTVNISQLAASNDWITQMSEQILVHVQPKVMVVCWGFVSRSDSDWVADANCTWKKYYDDVKDPSWPTCEDFREINKLPVDIVQEMKTVHHTGWRDWDDQAMVYISQPKTTIISKSTIEHDIDKLLGFVRRLQSCSDRTKIIYSGGPWFAPLEFENFILDSIAEITPWVVDPPEPIDCSRDVDHYGPMTAAQFAHDIAERI